MIREADQGSFGTQDKIHFRKQNSLEKYFKEKFDQFEEGAEDDQ